MIPRSAKTGTRTPAVGSGGRSSLRVGATACLMSLLLLTSLACSDSGSSGAAAPEEVAAATSTPESTPQASPVSAGKDEAGGAAGIPRSSRPEGARLYIIHPENGQTVSSPFTVRFGLGEMGVAPAGVMKEHTGHHHLIVDADLPPLDLPIPKSENYRHFGKGQTETQLDLPSG